MGPIITVEKLRYTYPGGTRALDGAGFVVEESERVAVVGGNGAGKTTLMLHLNGILRGGGTVTVAGMTVGRSPINNIRRAVGVVFQDPDDQLFMPTVLEDVAFGLLNAGYDPDAAKEKAVAVLNNLGAAHLANREPRELSVGEKKRVALAGVLALEPQVLALDEPAAGLDPRGRRALMVTINRINASIIIATHDLELALELCSRAFILGGGRIIREGTPAELFADWELMDANGLEVPYSLSRSAVGS
jgi:cobalt/nickel transport system ATP-binding protein